MNNILQNNILQIPYIDYCIAVNDLQSPQYIVNSFEQGKVQRL